jgi:cardiolipin synthase
MSDEGTGSGCEWLPTGKEAFGAMLAAIEAARESVQLETYIFAAGQPGERFRLALIHAKQRGVHVRVLLDALGSMSLPDNYWLALTTAGGEVRWFNPPLLNRFGIRDHRKLLVCDERVAFVGGFNIAPEYEGDGVTRGWCDLGMRTEGLLAKQLSAAFNEMFVRADQPRRPFPRLRNVGAKKTVSSVREQLHLSGPGLGVSPIKRALHQDLAVAQNVQIVMGYFLPTWRIRRALSRIARRGGRVELILAGKSDVPVSCLAARSLYRRLLKSGVVIREYEPQVLHAKLIIIDDVVYAGSANLDQRSLRVNYELMVRLEQSQLVCEARELFARWSEHCRVITSENWRETQTIWRRIKQRLAYILLVRLDTLVARWQWGTEGD